MIEVGWSEFAGLWAEGEKSATGGKLATAGEAKNGYLVTG